jgi:hypothetical protein
MTSIKFTMLARSACWMVVALSSATLFGCAAPSTQALDAKFGESVRSIRDSETIGATPAQRQDPVAGLDAAAAVHSQDRYQDSFKAPVKTFELFGSGR